MAGSPAWIAIVLAIGACAFEPRNQIAEGQSGAPGNQQVLLCPLNLVVPLRPEIRKGVQPVDQELVKYLESRGQKLSRLDRTEGRELWRQAVVASRSAGDPTRAPALFVGALAKAHAFDAVVVPSLLVVQTRIDASISEWDGVRRVMRMSHEPVIGMSPEDARFARIRFFGSRERGTMFEGISGEALVTSLHVLVYARDGSRVFEGRGGVDFLQEIEFTEPGKSLRFRLRPNGAIFLEPKLMNEAVEQAFTPYLVPADA